MNDALARNNAGFIDRRRFIGLASAAGIGALIGSAGRGVAGTSSQPATAPAGPELSRFPEKTDLILLTDRPPNLETPLKYFREDFTPNEAFFVRWHLANIPTRVDPASFELSISGHVEQELGLSLEDLRKRFEPVSLAALNQCSGNSRSQFSPRVFGGQWGNGAMGNARWTGVRLSDLLKKAGVKSGASDVSFSGLDKPPQPSVPAFVKSLPFERANDGEVMVAYEMNGSPLPMLNGFPLRLIVPGWFATYWVKSLSEITVLKGKFHGFWMDKAYRVPNNPECEETPKDQAKDTVPIGKMLVRSIFVRPEPGDRVKRGAVTEVQGLAMDGGAGIRRVELSADGGKTWADAALDPDLGKYSWRRWRFRWTPAAPGPVRIMVRATNAAGDTQRGEQNWNHSGYARNVIEAMQVIVE